MNMFLLTLLLTAPPAPILYHQTTVDVLELNHVDGQSSWGKWRESHLVGWCKTDNGLSYNQHDRSKLHYQWIVTVYSKGKSPWEPTQTDRETPVYLNHNYAQWENYRIYFKEFRTTFSYETPNFAKDIGIFKLNDEEGWLFDPLPRLGLPPYDSLRH